MKNFKSIFTEYQDPKVFRNMKGAFIVLFICGILVAFVAAPPLRHLVLPEHSSVGPAHAVTKVHRHHHAVSLPSQQQSSQSPSLRKDHPSEGNPTTSHEGGSGTHSGGSGGKGHGKGSPVVPGHPGTPPTSKPTPAIPNNPPASPVNEPNNGESHEGGDQGQGKDKGRGNGVLPPIIDLPKTPVSPVVEGVGGAANGVANGVTGSVNETTDHLHVHTEVPKVCVLKEC